jgi:hypothetical protein
VAGPDSWVVDFPTLGFLAADWVEQHCIVPDGFGKGDPFTMYDWQLWCTVNHYRVKPTAKFGQLGPAFHNRRSQVVAPQKTGKGPWSATVICIEALGPALFAGWAKGGELWECSDFGCGCGWVHEYEPGDPMGQPWPTPLIQITANSEDQTDNVYRPLKAMAGASPLAERMKVGEEFIRLPNDGLIEVVTSRARSRLGNPVTFVMQDESGLYLKTNGMVEVAETQRRGAAGMGGRTMETTNAWDPADESTAQRTARSKSPDIFRFHQVPPENLRYKVKADRQKIHRYVYAGSNHVDLDAIEAEAVELLEEDPVQAERFFGNRIRAAGDAAFDPDRWKKLADSKIVVPDRSLIVIGVDGARFEDAIGLIATDVAQAHQFVLGIWEKPEGADDDYEHPVDEIDGRMIEAQERFTVWRTYVDPQWIDHLMDRWQGRYGEKKILPWYTNRPKQIAYAIRNYAAAMNAGDLSHDGDADMAKHIAHARRRKLPVYDDDGRQMWTIAKDRPGSPDKIDAAMGGAISWEARGDAIAAGALEQSDEAWFI